MSEQLWQRYYGAPNLRYGNTRQYGVLIDLNKCLGCHTCQVVCKTTWSDGPGQEAMYWNRVTTRPFGQRGEDRPNLYGDVPAGAYPGLWQFYLPQICNHCSQPACLKACPTGAIYKRDDGFVLIDQDDCGGTRNCIRACPYEGISFNTETKTSQKCIGCYPLVEKGEEPLCVRSCIGKARLFGDLMDPGSFISRVIRSGDVDARPYLRDNQYPRIHDRAMSGGPVRQLRPDHGTSPNVWYIVPRGIPPEEVEKYFGMAMGGKREEPHEVPDNLKMKL